MKKERLKEFIMILVLIVLHNISSLGQPSNPAGQVELPSSANVTLGKFINIPVGHFTGSASVGIPLFSVEDGVLKHGISLNYHSSGIKVGEISSNVGIGWNLTAGGSVSRTIRGLPDDDIELGYLNHADSLSYNVYNLLNEVVDGEPDIYRFSMGAYSGKFFFDKYQNIVHLSKSDVKIDVDLSGLGFIQGFTITSPDGTRYIYGHYGSKYANESTIAEGSSTSAANEKSSWFLLRMETFDGSQAIDFDYELEEYNYRSRPTVLDGNNGGGPSTIPNFNGTDIFSSRLKTISSKNEVITFNYYTSKREDLNLRAGISTFQPSALQGIKYETGTFCKEYLFTHTYFEDTDYVPNFTSTGHKRLKLDEIQLQSCSGGNQLEIPEYIFSYYGSTNGNGSSFLPSRQSFARDHWGYYNGKDGNESLFPVQSWATGDDPQCPILGTADREGDEASKMIGLLSTYTNPMGGETSFEYESHKIDLSQQEMDVYTEVGRVQNCGSPFLSECCGALPDTMAFNCTAFEIDNGKLDIQLEDISQYYSMQGNCDQANQDYVVSYSFEIINTSTQTVVYSDSDMFKVFANVPPANSNEGKMVETSIDLKDIPLQAGVDYEMNIDVDNGKAAAVLSKPLTTSTAHEVAGVRVKKLTYEDGSAINPPIVTNYEYVMPDDDNKSSGHLFSIPRYCVSNLSDFVNPVVFNPGLWIWSNNPIIGPSDYEGREIGYEHVTETIAGQGGETQYSYFLEQISLAHINALAPVLPGFRNGNIVRKTVVSDGGAEPYIELYTPDLTRDYTTSVDTVFSIFPSGGVFFPYQMRTIDYRIDRVETVQDDVNSYESYSYDPLDRFKFPIAVETQNSDNKIHKTEMSYVLDYFDNEVKDTLIAQNRISAPWQTIKKVDGDIVDGNQTIYKFYDSDGFVKTIQRATTDILHINEAKRREVTWNSAGSRIDNGWQRQGSISKYEIARGKPAEILTEGWADTLKYTWTPSGKVQTWQFLSFIKDYQYFPNTNLLQEYTAIDGREESYTWDALLRLKTATNSQNVVSTKTYHYKTGVADHNFVETSSIFPSIPGSDISTIASVNYMDGLGRMIQNVEKNHAPDPLTDLIYAVDYDAVGRPVKQYEPLALSNNNGDFFSGVNSEPYAETTYHLDPLNRAETSTPPSWYATNMTYSSNEASDNVTGYGDEDLRKSSVIDPDLNEKVVFTDKLGRTVLERSQDANSQSDTYYTYDDKHRIKTMLPPGTSAANSGLIYTYVYDGDDNIIAKKVPDKNEETYLYNLRNLPVALQTPILLAQNKWLVSQYDEYGRITNKGFRNGSISNVESISIDSLLEQYFYDGFDGSVTVPDPIYVGKVRKERINILTESGGVGDEWIEKVYEYQNSNGLVSKETTTHHLDGVDVIDYFYDAADNIVKTVHTHDREGQATTITREFSLDHRGREKEASITVGANPKQLLTSSNYTYKSELLEKNIGAIPDISGRSFLQSIDYLYNDQGWLTDINTPALPSTLPTDPCDEVSSSFFVIPVIANDDSSDLFHEKINYVTNYDGKAENKNGNISSIIWQRGTAGYLNYQAYTYDFLDRVTDNKHLQNYGVGGIQDALTDQSTDYSYDARGNFDKVNRSGVLMPVCDAPKQIDKLEYFYYDNTNQIKQVKDLAPCEDYITLPVEIKRDMSFAANIDVIAQQTTIGSGANVSIYATTGALKIKDSLIIKDAETTTVNVYPGPCQVGTYYSGGFNQLSADGMYLYDVNGNLTYDPNKNMTIVYDYRNLPVKFVQDEAEVHIRRDALGMKLSKETFVGGLKVDSTLYVNGLEYKGDTLHIYHADGVVEKKPDNSLEYNYYVRDHLGNVRYYFSDSNDDGFISKTETEEHHYYPFGMETEGNWTKANEKGAYRYNEKEFDGFSGLVDYGARFYDPAIGRWGQVDPLAFLAPGWTPYRYGFNNPLLYSDPTGMFESREAAEEYATANGIKTGRWRRNKIKEQGDGTFAIENKKQHSSISDLGGDLGIMESAMVAATDRMESGIGINAFGDIGFVDRLRDGSTEFDAMFSPTMMIGGLGLGSKVSTSIVSQVAKSPVGRSGNVLVNSVPNVTRNLPTTINGRKFTGHALDQMQNRGIISPTAVDDVIRNASKVLPGNTPNSTVFFKGNLKVVTNNTGDVITVIYN